MRLTLMSLRNLSRRRLRTTLCILGVALSTMILIAVGATTTRYIAIIKEMNLLFDGDLVVVAKGVVVIQAFPIGGTIPENMVQAIKDVNGVKNATPLLFILNTEVSGITQLMPSNISIGVPAGNWSVLAGNTPLKLGGYWPTNATEEKAVVGPSIAGQYNLTVGSRIEVEKRLLEVAGILDTQVSILSRSIIMPLKTAQNLYGYIGLVSMIVVKPEEGVTLEELSQRIEKDVKAVKALTEKERNDVVEPMLNELERWNLGITAALLFLSMCLVATVTAMNISERKREFAILDAIGASKGIVIRMVAIETVIIGLLGSLTGLILGMVASLTIASFYTGIPIQLFIPSISDLLPASLVVEILTLTVAISCIGGIVSTVIVNRVLATETLRVEH